MVAAVAAVAVAAAAGVKFLVLAVLLGGICLAGKIFAQD